MLFDGFGSDDTAWSTGAGNWTRSGDNLIQSSTTTVGAIIERTDVAEGNVFIEVVYSFDSWGVTPNAGPLLRLDSSESGWCCALRYEASASALRHYRLDSGFANSMATDPTTGDIALDTDYLVTAAGYGNNTWCDEDGGDASTEYTSTWYLNGTVGFRTTRAAVTIAYFAVYSLGGTLP